MSVYELIRKISLESKTGEEEVCVYSIDNKGTEHTYDIDVIFPEYLGDSGEKPIITIKLKETF